MSRRGFTMIEAVLASIIGAMVFVTVMALLLGVQRVEQNSRVTADQTIQLTRAHRSLQRAFRQIVVSDGQPRNRGTTTGAGATSSTDSGKETSTTSESSSSQGTGSRLPATSTPSSSPSAGPLSGSDSASRSGGGKDTSSSKAANGGSDSRTGAGSDATRTAPVIDGPARVVLGTTADGAPSLEMLVAEAPVALPPGADAGLQFAMTRGAFVLRPTTEDADAVRPGAGNTSVLSGDDLRARVDELGGARGGFDLAWETYTLGSSPAMNRQILGRVVLCRHVAAFDMRFYKTNPDSLKLEPVQLSTVAVMRDLPAYAEVEMSLSTGRRVKWLFEIGWTTGFEPDGSSPERYSVSTDDEPATRDPASSTDGKGTNPAANGTGSGKGATRGGGNK